MKYLFLIICLFFTSISFAGDVEWKSYTKQLPESVWTVSFEYPTNLLVREGKDKTDFLLPSYPTKNSKPEILPNSILIFNISITKSTSLQPPKDTEKEVPFIGAKNNKAIRSDTQLKFITPDSKYQVELNGVGGIFEQVVKTVRIGK